MTSSVVVDVGSYGKIKGFTSGNVAEFRGVPFATIPARFRRSELISAVHCGTVHATKWGPIPPQVPYDEEAAISLFGEYMKTLLKKSPANHVMDEENCLNLNIVTPKDAIGKKMLPVLCWIYGMFMQGPN